MRQLRHALILATATAVVALAVGAWTELTTQARAASTLDAPSEVTAKTASVAERPVLFARVVKPFGASVRAVPSSEAAILYSIRCGDTWPVLSVEQGWVKIRTESGAGWVGGSRVAVSSAPPAVDCSDARFIYPTGSAATSVPSGCLSLRNRPSSEATILSCVDNGHVYAVLDGPFDPGSGDDWFRVSSPSTGSGWALAKHLYSR